MTQLLIHPFKVDATPPVGGYLCGGLHGPSTGIETPIFLRGMVFSLGQTRCVIAGIDYCYLCGRSYQRLVDALAQGAGVPSSHATLHANHTHDVPLIDEEPHALMSTSGGGGRPVHDEAYFARVIDDTRRAVAAAVATGGLAVGSFACTQHPVEQFASNRRVIDDKGRCHVRWSVCRDAWVRSQPEGRIDPMVSQVTFFGTGESQNKAMACISYYTSHPQVSDGRGLVSGDTVGVALDLFEKANPGVFSVYFNGCAGDITAGKYTTTDRPRNRLVLGVRLYDGIQGAFAKARPGAATVDSIAWTEHVIQLPLSPIAEPASHFEAVLRNSKLTNEKYLAAMRLDRLRRKIDTYPFRVARLRLGPVDLLFLPTELLIEYQFYAKSLLSRPVLVAAYGDSFLKYVPYDRAHDEGGYEVDPLWSEVGRGVEQPIKAAIREVLLRKI